MYVNITVQVQMKDEMAHRSGVEQTMVHASSKSAVLPSQAPMVAPGWPLA
jgi:hypothetical protein